ncbi:MAG: hypothetical protein ACTS6H_03100, partial [Candidatus Hodgkinia cicadicola]
LKRKNHFRRWRKHEEFAKVVSLPASERSSVALTNGKVAKLIHNIRRRRESATPSPVNNETSLQRGKSEIEQPNPNGGHRSLDLEMSLKLQVNAPFSDSNQC